MSLISRSRISLARAAIFSVSCVSILHLVTRVPKHTKTSRFSNSVLRMYSGEPGSGAGKGGGGGGAIRDAGGSFGKMEAAREDQYFYNKQKEQIENLKGHLDKEISFHQEQIKRHEDAIRRHKQQVAEMDKK